jgi:hypothetical protein
MHSYCLISWTYSSQPWQLQELRGVDVLASRITDQAIR